MLLFIQEKKLWCCIGLDGLKFIDYTGSFIKLYLKNSINPPDKFSIYQNTFTLNPCAGNRNK